jgi:chloride channel 3/4/5
VDFAGRALAVWNGCQGWIAAVMIGIFTAVVAYLVDVAEVTVADYKSGYCTSNIFHNREVCCQSVTRPLNENGVVLQACEAWQSWSQNFTGEFSAYVAFALLFGIIAGSVTMTTKANLPAVSPSDASGEQPQEARAVGKTMYMAAGSGIPEIKTILSGFVIPHFLDFKVLAVKAIGSTFAVATGMCLGKEGPFVHISTCAGYLVASLFPKYRENGRKMREMLSVACSSGLSVAFGAPIGGVLFSYEVSL